MRTDRSCFKGRPTAKHGWSPRRSSLYHFRALRVGTERQRAIHAAPTLDPSGQNLPEALLYLNTQSRPEWERIRNTMQELVPDIGLLATPGMGGSVEAVFIDPYL